MKLNSSHVDVLGRMACILSLFSLGYWGLYSLLVPITNIDSQMYNLARLELAMRGGFFGNGLFTSVYHVIHPWSFDAVHLPFMFLGWGFALPSFTCLTGICYIAFVMMRDRFDSTAGWLSVLGLLGLTCLVYQGSTTKNDIPVIFAGAVWLYAFWRRRRENRNVHLFWMVLAIGFMAGAKTTGLIYGVVLSLVTLWEMRLHRVIVIRLIAALATSVLFLGSVETYIESYRLFGNPLGPSNNLAVLKNQDGIEGGLANLSRHVIRSVYLGPTKSFTSPKEAVMLADFEKSFLWVTGLENAGTSPQFRDAHFFPYQSGFEELAGFGATGTLAMAMVITSLVFIRPRSLWWRLSMCALVILILISLSVSYSAWSARYLLGFYTLSTLAVISFVWEYSNGRYFKPLAWSLLLVTAGSAVAAPLLSFNRTPADLLLAVSDREALETSSQPILGALRSKLRELRKTYPSDRIFYCVRSEYAVLPLITDKALNVMLISPATFIKMFVDGDARPGDIFAGISPPDEWSFETVAELSAPNPFIQDDIHTKNIYRATARTLQSVPLYQPVR